LSVGARLRVATITRAPSALACTALWVIGTFVVYTYLGSILQQITHAPATARSWLLLLFGLGSCLGVFTGGRLADRANPTLSLAASIVALVLVLIGLTWALHSLTGAAIGLTVWGAVHWASFPLIQHRLLEIGRERGDTLLAVNNSAVYLGQSAAAVLGGVLAGASGLTLAPLVGAGFQILALGALLLGGAPDHHRTGSETTDSPAAVSTSPRAPHSQRR
jgi:predicted MFS family arabinose efflux permease